MFKYVVGGILTFMGTALELMMQVSSHDAAANACTYLAHYWRTCAQTLPNWFSDNAYLLPAILMVGGLIIILWAPLRALKRRFSFEHQFVPLREAAAKIYGDLRGTDLGRFTEGHTGEADEILDNVGMQILHNAPVYVRRAPSPKWELFPVSELNKMGVCNGATGIRYWGEDRVLFSDPKVSRRNLRRVSKSLRQNANYRSEWSKHPPKQAGARQENAEIASPLKLSVGTEPPYYELIDRMTMGLWTLKKLFKVKIENTAVQKPQLDARFQFCLLIHLPDIARLGF
jgi:hypothetical protein